ncbi:site-2 protease family protein [Streptomyces sp. AK010]|uniref:site-2 protease family protein n=1 Tax=Streptomyces sp. AK010 TaxID=2723074 RepID=UPI001610A2D7|nr:site-2 protease family protein [Streptomyces sp. AK010]MBB6416497.1 Zn-dependent protease/CBS domain-containing protein [Streptomyces sp. AK010]
MDESGGRGRPRSGNDESAERHAGPAARAAEPTSAEPTDERPFTPERPSPAPEPTSAEPTDERPFTPERPSPAPEPTGPATPADTPATPSDAARDDSAADRPTRGDEAPAEPDANGLPEGDTHPGRPDAENPHTAPTDAAVPQAAPAPGERDGGDAPEGDTHPDRAYADDRHTAPVPADADAAVPQAAPAPGERDGGDAPEGDTHPDRAYASGPHSAPVPGGPEADRLHKAHAPAPGSGDQNRPLQPSAPAPGTGHPNHHPAPSAPADGDRHLAHSDGKGPAPHRPEPRGGLLMGRPFGVPVYVAPSWFLVAALITWVFGGQLERVLPELGAARYLVSLFFAVAFYASVLVHELAHTVAALRFKLPVRRIQLQFFGGVSEIEKEAETPGREFILAFVGPLLSLVLAGVFYGAAQTVEPGTVPGVLLAGLMISNLIVAAFNLLPGLPLDGGRMLRAVVWKITGKPMKGTIAAAWVGRALAVSVLIGLPLLTQSGALGTDAVDNVGMDTVLDALLAAILAAIIWTGAGNSLRMARLREHLPELRARALTRRAVPVESDTPLSEALRRANAAGARALVVVDPDGKPLSLVREAAIVGVPEHRRPWVAVSGLAQDLTDGMRVSAELSGEELLDALRATPATEYLVVEATGEIYGVLSAADVERAFVKAMARPS